MAYFQDLQCRYFGNLIEPELIKNSIMLDFLDARIRYQGSQCMLDIFKSDQLISIQYAWKTEIQCELFDVLTDLSVAAFLLKARVIFSKVRSS